MFLLTNYGFACSRHTVKDVAISRIEQISPFPYDLITPHLDQYPNADILYAQEEVRVVMRGYTFLARAVD